MKFEVLVVYLCTIPLSVLFCSHPSPAHANSATREVLLCKNLTEDITITGGKVELQTIPLNDEGIYRIVHEREEEGDSIVYADADCFSNQDVAGVAIPGEGIILNQSHRARIESVRARLKQREEQINQRIEDIQERKSNLEQRMNRMRNRHQNRRN